MPKINKAHKNYLTPEIWEEMYLREIFCDTLIFQQSSTICIDHHVGIEAKLLFACILLSIWELCLDVLLTFSLKFNRAPYNSYRSTNIMSKLIAFGELICQPFVLPVILTCHVQSYWKWNKLKFPCCSVISVTSHACSTENNIPFPNLANHKCTFQILESWPWPWGNPIIYFHCWQWVL